MILRGSVLSKILEMETGITIVTPNDFKAGRAYQVGLSASWSLGEKWGLG